MQCVHSVTTVLRHSRLLSFLCVVYAMPRSRLIFVSLQWSRRCVIVCPALLDSPLVRFPVNIDAVTVYPRGNDIAVRACVGRQEHEYRSDGKYVIRNHGRGPGFIHSSKTIADGVARHAALRKYVCRVCMRIAGTAASPL